MAEGTVASASADQTKDAVLIGGGKDIVVLCDLAQLAAQSGHYYDDCRRTEPSAVATRQLGAELWDRSIAWVDLPR